MDKSKEAPISARALVAYEPKNGHMNMKLQNVTLRELKPDELLVRIVATGVCHTDLFFGMLPKEVRPYPKVLGHEGLQVAAFFHLNFLTAL